MKLTHTLGVSACTLVLVVMLAGAGACGPSVQQACEDYGAAYCERTYACDTGAQLAAIQAVNGATVDDCKAKLTQDCHGALSTCPTGTNYDTGAAETCVANYRAASCDQITQPNYVPAGCAQSDVCH
jgi:hypothetical protein